MSYTSYTIYFGTLSTTVGITIKPTPSLTLKELKTFIAELQAIHDEVKERAAFLHADNWED